MKLLTAQLANSVGDGIFILTSALYNRLPGVQVSLRVAANRGWPCCGTARTP